MNKFYWFLTILSAFTFFYYFWTFNPPKLAENKVKLSLSLEPNSFSTNDFIQIKLNAENPINQGFSSEEYYYRVIINRSYFYSPGFIIKEFSKNLTQKGSFEETFTWKKEYLPNEEFKYRVHFNMYRRKGSKEPDIVSSSTGILFVKKQ